MNRFNFRHGFAIATCSGLILATWLFPAIWYTRDDPQQKRLWFAERTNLDHWVFQAIPVAQSAEARLVADELLNGAFTNDRGEVIRVFSAKRFSGKPNEIGLFVHTPDRCWTEAGWRLEPVFPDTAALDLHGLRCQFERRIFSFHGGRELVYFGGFVGGQNLPYRLDHNLSVGMKQSLRVNVDRSGTALRVSDSRFWKRVLDSFLSRRPLLGPKQFLRISTPIQGEDIARGDERLRQFLGRWLAPLDFQEEVRKRAAQLPSGAW